MPTMLETQNGILVSKTTQVLFSFECFVFKV